MRILIVDDSLAMRQVHRRILGEMGLTDLVEAANGEEALKAVAAGGIDLVICDVRMPGISGIDFVSRLKSDPATQSIPVIMATSESLRSTVLQAIKAGADGYVFKPIKPEDMKDALEPYLKK